MASPNLPMLFPMLQGATTSVAMLIRAAPRRFCLRSPLKLRQKVAGGRSASYDKSSAAQGTNFPRAVQPSAPTSRAKLTRWRLLMWWGPVGSGWKCRLGVAADPHLLGPPIGSRWKIPQSPDIGPARDRACSRHLRERVFSSAADHVRGPRLTAQGGGAKKGRHLEVRASYLRRGEPRRMRTRQIRYAVWYCAIAITARVSVLLGCRSSSRIVK